MKTITGALNALVLLIFGLTALQAQEAVSASGDNASGSGGTISYTVGQVFYNCNTGSAGTVTEGVQQPFEILVVSSLEEAKGINLICLAYPNPATDFLILKIENYAFENLTWHLYDMNGKLIQSKKVDGNKTNISMENLIPSTYLLKVTDVQNEVKTFSIIKTR